MSSKREEVRLLLKSRNILGSTVVPHRTTQNQINSMVESIEEEILIELLNTDLGDHVSQLDDPWPFIEKWAETEENSNDE